MKLNVYEKLGYGPLKKRRIFMAEYRRFAISQLEASMTGNRSLREELVTG